MHMTLTPRELEVLTLASAGDTSQKIAEMLFISRRTVGFHLQNVCEKLHVSNRIQACRQAQKLGLLPSTPQS